MPAVTSLLTYLIRNTATPRERQISETRAFEERREETSIRHEATTVEFKLHQRRTTSIGQLQKGRVAHNLEKKHKNKRGKDFYGI